MDKEILIDLIAIGLPNYASDKIDGENLEKTANLWPDQKNKIINKLLVKFVKNMEKEPVTMMMLYVG